MFKLSHFPSFLVGYVITQRFIAKTVNFKIVRSTQHCERLRQKVFADRSCLWPVREWTGHDTVTKVNVVKCSTLQCGSTGVPLNIHLKTLRIVHSKVNQVGRNDNSSKIRLLLTFSECRIEKRVFLIPEHSYISRKPVYSSFTERNNCKLVGIFNGVRRDVSPESDTYPGSDLSSRHCVKKQSNKRRKTQLHSQRSPPKRRHTHRCPPVTFTVLG